ncbi:MAG: Unknown protein [uncultured Thiotrichaceae bacterium]|uniref:Lipoprotein n=1 Tax=uncultured Thiotrichaceae bacterium TaxID=298394 RepID=A0A6S6TZC2_9GAMM|nr:MAG: Unknown protein [uncultured Thiotrichaceae bacterium]
MLRKISVIIAALFMMSSCASVGNVPSANEIEEKRQKVLNMRDSSLNDLYKIRPYLRSRIAQAPGYAVFSDKNVNLVLASFSGGQGVVTSNQTGRNTYMNMGEIGIGLGLGLKDFRTIFVFNDSATMDKFINEGWQFGGQADAAAVDDKDGGALAGQIVVDNISVYQLTKRGLALQAIVKGTKYWKSPTLN